MKKKIIYTIIGACIGAGSFLIGNGIAATATAELTDSAYDYNNYMLDMRNVVDFKTVNGNLEIILKDGNCYYWEK